MSLLSGADPAPSNMPVPKHVLVAEYVCMHDSVVRPILLLGGSLDQVLLARARQRLPPRMQLDRFLQWHLRGKRWLRRVPWPAPLLDKLRTNWIENGFAIPRQ